MTPDRQPLEERVGKINEEIAALRTRLRTEEHKKREIQDEWDRLSAICGRLRAALLDMVGEDMVDLPLYAKRREAMEVNVEMLQDVKMRHAIVISIMSRTEQKVEDLKAEQAGLRATLDQVAPLVLFRKRR